MSDALANVILQEGPRETILGQAWLAAPGRMITCGHVVERFAGNPMGLYVKFPSSGNVYPVQMVRLHPSFVRQPDQLVKFDVALLEVNFGPPESAATPLPFSYEQPLQTNQTLWVIRYPTHLAQLSAATQPLTQDGKFLGPLRKHDSFHLLHDLPLAPGDSGAPITDGNTILALHCGDTATIPGLNLPTTSIRLALWVDSLRELGLNETVKPGSGSSIKLFPAVLAFVVSLMIGGVGAWYVLTADFNSHWTPQPPAASPVRIEFNKPLNGYKDDEQIRITLVPQAASYIYLFEIGGKDEVFRLFPQEPPEQDFLLRKGEEKVISSVGENELHATSAPDKLLLVAIDAKAPNIKELTSAILTSEDLPPLAPRGANEEERDFKLRRISEQFSTPLTPKGRQIKARVNALISKYPSLILQAEFDAPRSTSK